MRDDLERLHAKLTADAQNHMTSSKAHRACTEHERHKLVTLAAEKRSIAREIRKILDADLAAAAPPEVRPDAAGQEAGLRPPQGSGDGDTGGVQDGALAGAQGAAVEDRAAVPHVREEWPRTDRVDL